MDEFGKVYYRFQKNNEDEIRVKNGVLYCEIPSIFRKKTKEVKIVFKDKKGKGDKYGK